MVVGDSGEAGGGEGGGVVGEVGGAEAGEDAEGEVEAADEEVGGEAHGAGGDAEVGDEPEGSGSEGGGDAGDEGVEFGLGEAVEEEVGDDEVVRVWLRGKVRALAWWVWRRVAALGVAASQRWRRSWSMVALVSTASAWRWGLAARSWAGKRPSPSPRMRAWRRLRSAGDGGCGSFRGRGRG